MSPLGLERQPKRPVHREDQHEENAPHKPVGVQQGKKRSLIDSAFIDQNAAKQIGESHAEQQGRTEVSDPQQERPRTFSSRPMRTWT